MKKIPAWMTLLIITLVAGVLLSCTNALTAPVIAEQTAAAAEASRAAVLPAAAEFLQLETPEDGPVDWCYEGSSAGDTVGYVVQTTVAGFNNNIEVIVGVDTEGVITGVSVGGPDFAETAGLGAKTRDAAFYGQYSGKTAPLRVIKAGAAAAEDTIDAVTAATISSTAVTNAVNTAATYAVGLLSEED